MTARRGDAATRGFIDGVALGMLHPDEPAVPFVPFRQIPHARWESIASRDYSAVDCDDNGSDLANSIRLEARGRRGPAASVLRCSSSSSFGRRWFAPESLSEGERRVRSLHAEQEQLA